MVIIGKSSFRIFDQHKQLIADLSDRLISCSVVYTADYVDRHVLGGYSSKEAIGKRYDIEIEGTGTLDIKKLFLATTYWLEYQPHDQSAYFIGEGCVLEMGYRNYDVFTWYLKFVSAEMRPGRLSEEKLAVEIAITKGRRIAREGL